MCPDYDDEILQTYLDISGMVTSNIQDLALEDNCHKTVMEIHREGDPWDFDDLEVDQVKQEQRGMPEYQLAQENKDEYVLDEGLLYTLRPPSGKTSYPRLVLPSTRFQVIRRAHQEVGHQGVRKTLERLQKNYKWPSQSKDVFNVIKKCARCLRCREQGHWARDCPLNG